MWLYIVVYLPEGNAVDLGGSVGVVLLVPGLKSFT